MAKKTKTSRTEKVSAAKRSLKKKQAKTTRARKAVARKANRPAKKRAANRVATRGVAPPDDLRRALGATAVVGTCLDLGTAGEIVQAAIPGGPHDIDSTLEGAGLISVGERIVFREDVVRRVEDHGCSIDEADVPNDATTTLRQARTAVRDNSGPR